MADTIEIDAMKAPLPELGVQSKLKRQRVEELQQQLQQAVQEESTVNASYRKHLIRCARADCLQLTKMMHDKLPRELRDLVYHYLLVDERPIPVGPYYHFRKYESLSRDPPLHSTIPRGVFGNVHLVDGATSNVVATDSRQVNNIDMESAPDNDMIFKDIESDDEDIAFDNDVVILPDGRIKHDHSHRPPGDIVLPSSHVLNPRYVGESFMAEAQKVYYANNTFSICNVERAFLNFLESRPRSSFKRRRNGNLPQLSESLRMQSFSVPAKWVRNLQIRVKFEHFKSTMPQGATEEEEYAYERRFLRYEYNSLFALEDLIRTSEQKELNIEFILMTELPALDNDVDSEDRRFVNFLQAIRNTVYTTMYGREGTTVKVTHHDEMMWPFPRNLTGLFGLTKEQWEQEKATHRGQGSRVADFYLAPASLDVETLSGGFSGREMLPLLRERWGIDSVLDTKCKYPIKEGKYWPKGNGGPSWV